EGPLARYGFGLLSLLILFLGCGSSTERKLQTISAGDLIKVEQKVVDALSAQGMATVVVHLAERAELADIAARDWKTRGQGVVNALRTVADRSQASILRYLRLNASLNKAAEIDSLWICNCVVVTADEDTIATLAERFDV